MGLLDILLGRREATSHTATKVLADGTRLTSTVRFSISESRDEAPESDYPTPPDTLRALKAYSENVSNPCGFDFSAIRRCHGQLGVWWLDGENFRRACDALRSLERFQHEARDIVPDFPDAIAYILGLSVPYAHLADGNRVPTISVDTTKKRGTCVSAHFGLMPSEQSDAAYATIWFRQDGKVSEASVSYFSGRDKWRMVMDTPKRTGALELKSATKDTKERRY